jgi:hypothetical protein
LSTKLLVVVRDAKVLPEFFTLYAEQIAEVSCGDAKVI